MTEKISTLLDGELPREEATTAIRGLGTDPALRAAWERYHLIGDVMRGDTPGEVMRRRQSTEAIFAQLAKEPTVLTPGALTVPAPSGQGRIRVAMAMAASLVTISAIAVIAMKQPDGVVVHVARPAPPPVSLPVSQPIATPQDSRVNDYLAIHRQYANPQALKAVAARREAPRAAGQ